MPSMTRSRWTHTLIICLLLTGCRASDAAPQATPSPAPATPTQQAAAAPPTPTPPTAEQRLIQYRHPSGLFTLLIPEGWEVLEDTTGQRISLRLLPPPGFGSRIALQVSHEGPLDQAGLETFISHTLEELYPAEGPYTALNTGEFTDGQLEALYRYDDGRGGRGQETLTISQQGRYMVVQRIFLAERDAEILSEAMGTVNASLTLDQNVTWGSPVAGINPAEVFLVNTLVWQDDDGLTHFTGEIFNTAPVDIREITLQVAFCNQANAVLQEVNQPAGFDLIGQGRSIPFGVSVEGLEAAGQIKICAQQVQARPAQPDPDYVTGLELASQANRDRGDLIINGTVSNPTLAAVEQVEIALAAYDFQDRIIGYALVGVPGTLPPGGSAAFEHRFTALGGDPDRFVALAQGRAAAPFAPALAP